MAMGRNPRRWIMMARAPRNATMRSATARREFEQVEEKA
jgi:hypothetical protein